MSIKTKIKTGLLVIFWCLLLSSCKEISFREPQPAGVSALKEVPGALRGQYQGIDDKGKDTDTLIVESWGYRFNDGKGNEWLGRGVISDSLVIKSYSDYYFVNFKTGDQWILRVIKRKSSGDLEFMSINLADDKKRESVLKKLAKKFPVKEIKVKDDTFYQINPNKEQLLQLIKEGYFSSNDLEKVK